MFIIGFNKVKTTAKKNQNNTQFSIIIPFRNEENHLLELLNSVALLQYKTTLFEIILVDDESTDKSVEIIKQFSNNNSAIDLKIISNIRQSNSPKKDAISTAISITKYNWIITTDADCILPITWLSSFSNFINEYDPNMLVAPVSFKSDQSFLHQFQLIDFLSMQGATIGGFGIQHPFMANGANLAYKKEIFLQLDGFNNNNFIASGDDVFLLENFVIHDKTKVLFLKNIKALVITFPTKNWNELIQQRKRWAAKATHFKSTFAKGVGILVFLTNCVIIYTLLIGFFEPSFLFFFVSKFTLDTLLIYKTAKCYHEKIKLTSYLKTLLCYSLFTIFIAATSIMSSFEWKGRNFTK